MTPIALDIHAHLIPVHEGLDQCDGTSWDAEAGAMIIDGHRVGVKPLFRPQALLDWMTAEQVAHAWISAPPPTYRQHLRGDPARTWVRYLNDGLAEVAAGTPERLTALPHIAVQDIDVALETIDEWTARGARHFSMPTGTGDERTLADAEFLDLWARLDDISARVFLHPGVCADGRLKAFYLENLLGNPTESAVAISHLVLGGILEKFTRVTPCFAHGGGTFPLVADRLQRGFETERPGIDRTATPPRELLSRIVVDCICHSEKAVELAETVFGAENVVFGSDWPFPMGLVKPHAQTAGFEADRLERIFRINPERLLNTTK